MIILLILVASILAKFDPPIMGWSTWCTDNKLPCRGDYCDEKEILDVAKFINSTLMEYGYEWIYVDDCWAGYRDKETHELHWDEKRFPSGIPSLVKKIHDLGLKISLYTDIGPTTCVGGRPGSWPWYELDVKTFTDWNVDGIKVDFCDHPSQYTAKQLYSNYSNYLSALGSKIHFSLCEWGVDDPWTWAPGIYNGSMMWRTGGDHHPTWYNKDGSGTYNVIQHQIGLSKYPSSGKWNDPDYLMLGYFWQSEEQQRTEFSFWCLLNSPLIIATDIRVLHDKKELLNREAISINQDPLGQQGDLRSKTSKNGQIWSKELYDGDHAVLLFNSNGILDSDVSIWIDIQFDINDSMLPGWPKNCKKAQIYDLWEHKSLGNFENSYEGKNIISRGSQFLRVKPLC